MVLFSHQQSAAYLSHTWKVSPQKFMIQKTGELSMYYRISLYCYCTFRAPIPRFATKGITPWQTD
jgi:hypothetical protein